MVVEAIGDHVVPARSSVMTNASVEPYVDEIAADPEEIETDKERLKREKAELEAKLKEYGGQIGFFALFSLATRREIFVFSIGCLCAFLHGFGQVAIQFFFGDLTDALGTGEGIMEVMGEVAMKLAIVGAAVWVVASVYGFAFPWFVEKQLQKIRPMYFDACIHRDIGWFDTHDAASISTEMGADVEQYAEGLGTKFANAWMSCAMFFGGYAIAFMKSWKLTLVMTGALPFMLVGFAIMGKAADGMVKEEQGGYAKASSIVDECLFAIRTVVSFGGEVRELKRFGDAVEIARRAGIKNRVTVGIGMGYFMGAMMATFGLAFWFGSWLIRNADASQDAALTGGDILASFGAVLMGGFGLSQGLPGLIENNKAKSSMTRFFWLVKNEATIQRMREDERQLLEVPVTTFELQNVHFAYPARPHCKVLNGVCLKIDKGQKVALVGESGSGKSTVMALLERFYDPTQGTVLINGQDFRLLNISSVRRFIGYVGQEPVLFATSVEKNIRMGCPDATDDDVRRVVKQAQMTFIDGLPDKLATYVGSGGSQFSGGQKQRIAIARALLKKPSVLFLDEATSALDNKSERMIQATIDDISRSSAAGMAIVSIAHRLSTIQNSDVIFVFKSGVVVESGSHAELVQREGGLYKALAAAQRVTLEGEDSHEEVAVNSQRFTSTTSEVSRRTSNSKNLSKEASKPLMDGDQMEKAREQEILKTYKVPLARLMAFCKREWPLIPPGCLFAAVSGVTFPIMGAVILNRAINSIFLSQWDKVNEYCVMFAIIGAVKFVSQSLQFTCFGFVGEGLTKRCRIKILTTIMSQEIGFHDDPAHTPGQLAKALQLYSYRVQRLALSIGDTADAFCTLGCGLFLAFYYCWQLALFALGFMPILAASQVIQQKLQMGGAKEENATLKMSAQLLQDALTNAKTVHACGNEKELVQLYAKSIESIHKNMFARHMKSAIMTGFSFGFIMWFIAGTFYFMAWLIDEGHSDFQDSFGAFMGLIYGAMMAASAFALTGDISKAKISSHDMFKLIDRKSEIDGLCPIGDTPALTETFQVGHFDFENVSFHYPFRMDVEVLKGMSFTITAGQSVGVVGPSGGGKSTVMALIQRFYDPQGGAVYIGGGASRLPLNSVNIRWWRKQVGFVGQEPILFAGTILDNVKYGVEEEEIITDEHLEKCKQDAFLTFMDGPTSNGWQTQVGPRGGRLSGGQKQRVAICRALIRNPRVILLDEATSALDSQSEKIVSKALERARAGRTSFAIAHRLSTVQNCDVIIVVADGKIVEQGSHVELMERGGVYHKLQQSSGN